MTTKPCTCAEDDWMGARGHINLTLNGHWPLSDTDQTVECQVCGGTVDRDYADPTKPALDHAPLYETPAEWWAALNAGIGYRLTPDQVKAAAKAERKRAKDDK